MDYKDLDVFNIAMELGEMTWNLIDNWNHFAKFTLGEQWIGAADSIAANISEGEGRYSYPDRKRFYYIARGSLNESETWITKSYNRSLINEMQKEIYKKLIDTCRKKINGSIKQLIKLNSQ